MEHQGTNRPDLRDAALEYSTALTHLMGTQILPVYSTPDAKGEFDKVAVSEALKTVGNLKRARKAAYPEIEHVTTSDTFDAIEYALAEPLDRHQDKARLDKVFDTETAITNLLVLHLMIEHERRVAAAVFNATTFASYTAGVSTEWNNAGNPYDDVQDTLLTLKRNVGGVIAPGSEICLAFSEAVFNNVVQNSNVKALLGGGQYSANDATVATPQRLASILGVNRVLVSPAQYNATDIWDDEYAMLFIRRTDSELRNGIQMGRTFIVDDAENMSPWGAETFSENNPPNNYVAVWHQTAEKILTLQAGYLLSNITT